MTSPIPYGKHVLDNDDIAAVVDVLENHFLTQGKKVPAFEKALADYADVNYAVAVNSGTSALHIACLALGLKKGDIAWTTPNTFVASANCALYCGADVDFVDIDLATRNISIAMLADKLALAAEKNVLPKVIILVHFAGLSCDMKVMSELCERYEVKIIEDASHAFGGEYQGYKIGHCSYSLMTICSFHPVKPITTAEGGAVLTNDEELRDRLNLFAKHGVTRDIDLMNRQYRDDAQGDWYYQQVELGYNYRLSDLQAALGLSQLTKLTEFTQQRRLLAKRYAQLLQPLATRGEIVLPLNDDAAAWHIYVIEIKNKPRKIVFELMRKAQIGVNVHYIPVHLQPFYQQRGFKVGDFPNAEYFYQTALTLPLYPTLTHREQDRVIAELTQALCYEADE